MARRRRSTPVTHVLERRRTTWARHSDTVSLASNTTYVNDDILASFKADGGSTQGVTIARIRMRLAVTTITGAGDSFYLGILRGQNTDVGTTVAGAPNPQADPYEDWLYWSQFVAGNQGGASDPYFPGGGNTYEIDIKAMRKIPELQQVLLLSVGTSSSATYPLQIVVSTSTLLMLP